MPFLVLTQLLENMTEVVRKGIQEAQVQLQKANEERLLEEVRLQGGLPSWPQGGLPSWPQAGRQPPQDGLEQRLCFAGGVTANPRGRIRAELVFSSTGFTKGKNF